jgi:hypothetical protein
VTDQYSAGTPDEYNVAVSQLQQTVASANSAEEQRQAQAKAAQQAAAAAQEATMSASCSKHRGHYEGAGECLDVPDGHGHTFYVPLNPDGSPQSGGWPADSQASSSTTGAAQSPPPTTNPSYHCKGPDGATYVINSTDIPPGYSDCH